MPAFGAAPLAPRSLREHMERIKATPDAFSLVSEMYLRRVAPGRGEACYEINSRQAALRLREKRLQLDLCAKDGPSRSPSPTGLRSRSPSPVPVGSTPKPSNPLNVNLMALFAGEGSFPKANSATSNKTGGKPGNQSLTAKGSQAESSLGRPRMSGSSKRSPIKLSRLNTIQAAGASAGPAGTPPSSGKRTPTKATKAGKASGGRGGKTSKSTLEIDDGSLITSAELRSQAAALEGQAKEFEESAERIKSSTFERQLGRAVLAKTVGKPLADVIREWDKNGDGDISQIEFRACVRNSLGLKAKNEEIDAFFVTLDADGGGSLDLAELKMALKKIRAAAAAADAEADKIRSDAQALVTNAADLVVVAEATEACEADEARLAQLQDIRTVESRLGAKIVMNGWKLADVMRIWDKDKDGAVSKTEFRKIVKEMKVEGTVHEVDAFFDSYDSDGGGQLDLHELQPTLKKLINAAHETKVCLDEAVKAHTATRKAAFKAQRKLAARRAAEAAAQELAEAATAKVAEEAKAEEEERKRLARETREAQEAQKAAEKAEYDAKIAARRAGVSFEPKSLWKAAGNAVMLTNLLTTSAAVS